MIYRLVVVYSLSIQARENINNTIFSLFSFVNSHKKSAGIFNHGSPLTADHDADTNKNRELI